MLYVYKHVIGHYLYLMSIAYFLCSAPLTLTCVGKLRANSEISAKIELKLPVRKTSHPIGLVNGLIRDWNSSFSAPNFTFQDLQLVGNYAIESPGTNDDSGEVRGDKTENSGNNVEGCNGNGSIGSGNGDGNDNGNGNGSDEGNNEGPEFNDERLTGLEWWWWWWKWQQIRHKTDSSQPRNLWPVDTAVKLVANGVKETIVPAVRAIVLGPIRDHVTMEGLLLLLVFGAFVMSFIQMFVGLAIVSTGVSLVGLAAIVVGLLWLPWKLQLSQGKGDNVGGDNT